MLPGSAPPFPSLQHMICTGLSLRSLLISQFPARAYLLTSPAVSVRQQASTAGIPSPLDWPPARHDRRAAYCMQQRIKSNEGAVALSLQNWTTSLCRDPKKIRSAALMPLFVYRKHS